NNQNTF
nr:Chain A, Major prion protein [synthetic construct]